MNKIIFLFEKKKIFYPYKNYGPIIEYNFYFYKHLIAKKLN